MNRLTQAIRQKRRIVADYTPVRRGTAGERTLEPHVLGTKKGHRLLRAWVHKGTSYSGLAKRWRLFRVDNLSNVRLLNETFPERNLYNPDGDRAMSHILAQVPGPVQTRARARAPVDAPAYNTRSRRIR